MIVIYKELMICIFVICYFDYYSYYFQSTSEFLNKDKILFELEKYGGICDCEASR